MARYSFADKTALKFPVLFIEASIAGLFLSFLVIWAKFMDKTIFLVVAIAFLIIGAFFEFKYAGSATQGLLIRGGGVEPAALLNQAYIGRDTGTAAQHAEILPTEGPVNKIIIDKRLSRNITKAFGLSAIFLWLFVEAQLMDNPEIVQFSKASIVAVLLLVFPLIGIAFLQGMRNPKFASSRIFDHYINLSVLILGIPSAIFLIFLVSILVLLLLVPQSSSFTQIISSALLLSIIVMVVFQAYYIWNTLQRSAEYHGLSVSEYIALRLSQEEKKRQKDEKAKIGERIDKLYEQIPDIKEEIRPSKTKSAILAAPRSMDDYEYATNEGLLCKFIKGFLPGLVAVTFGTLIYAAFFLLLAQMSGF